MKNYSLLATACLAVPILLSSVAHSADDKKKDNKDLTPTLLRKDLWETKISDFKKSHKEFNFKWMSSAKQRLRSLGENSQSFGSPTGELLIRATKDGKLSGFTISFYNRGDDGSTSSNQFNALHKKISEQISAVTKSRPEDKSSKGTVAMTKTFWRLNDTAFQLEKSISKSSKRPEFLRLRVASLKSSRAGNKTASRSSLKENVVKDANGDVYISNIPMVDQGKKGYCVAASAARIYQYYGRETDQHEIAQLSGTTASTGTQINEMVSALKKVTGKLNSRIVILYEYPKGMANLPTDKERAAGKTRERDYKKILMGLDEMKRDVNNYQKLAKKKKAKSVFGGSDYDKFDRKTQFGFPQMDQFRQICDPLVYREVMVKKSSYRRFRSKIKEYINQGVPIAWTLQLGMFPEQGLPQTSGGHMRLIIGYNEDTDTLIYSDSWGQGHEKKSIDAGSAFCMTSAIIAMPPTR